MADLTPEDLSRAAQAIAQAADEMSRYGYVTSDTKDRLTEFGRSVDSVRRANEKYSDSMSKELQKLSQNFGSAQEGIEQYSDTIYKAAKSIPGVLDEVMRGLNDRYKKLSDDIKSKVETNFNFVKRSFRLTDDLYKAYNELSRAGVTGGKDFATGMSGVLDQLQAFGYQVDGIGAAKLKALTASFGDTMQMMSGSLMNGSAALGEYSTELRQNEELIKGLNNLGINFDEANLYLSGYMRTQVRYGLQEQKSREEIIRQSAAYAKELDSLAKLAGITREQYETAREELESEEAFRAYKELETMKIVELRKKSTQKGDVYDIEAQRMEDLLTAQANAALALSKKSPALAKGYVDTITGRISEEYGSFQLATGGRGLEIASLKTKDAILQGVAEALTTTVKSKEYLTLAQRGGGVGEFLGLGPKGLAQTLDLIKSYQNATEQGTKIAEAQTKAQSKKDNALTDSYTELIRSQFNLRQAFETTASYFSTWATKKSAEQIAAAFKAISAAAQVFGEEAKPYPERKRRLPETIPETPQPPKPPGTGGPAGLGASNVSPELTSLVRKISKAYPGIEITALNDMYHQALGDFNSHTQGRAVDFTLPPGLARQISGNPAASQRIIDQIKSMGAAMVTDEYNYKSDNWKGPHIHAELKYGGVTRGPSIAGEGFTPEAVIPLTTGEAIKVEFAGMNEQLSRQSGKLDDQISRLDELITQMRRMNDSNTRIYQSLS